jgi:hypothetical protein
MYDERREEGIERYRRKGERNGRERDREREKKESANCITKCLDIS